MNEQPRTRTRTRLAPGLRRASILDAATRLILRDGATGLTMEDIAAEAGVARGTLYLYFDSIDGITGALRDRYAQALTGDLEPLLATGGSGSRLRRLDTFIAALAHALHDHQDLHHALLRRFITDGRDAGEFPVPDPGLTTSFLLAGLHAVLTEGLHKTSTATTIAAAQKLARRTLSP